MTSSAPRRYSRAPTPDREGGGRPRSFRCARVAAPCRKRSPSTAGSSPSRSRSTTCFPSSRWGWRCSWSCSRAWACGGVSRVGTRRRASGGASSRWRSPSAWPPGSQWSSSSARIGHVLALCGTGRRPAAGDGGVVRVLPRIELPGPLPFRRGEAGPGGSPARFGDGLRRLLDLGLLHPGDGRVPATPHGPRGAARRHAGAREPRRLARQLLVELAVRTQHERLGGDGVGGGGLGRRVLPALRPSRGPRAGLRQGRCPRRAPCRALPGLPERRRAGAQRGAGPTGDAGGDGGPVSHAGGRAAGAHRPAEPGGAQPRQPARGAPMSLVPHLPALARGDPRSRRLPARPMAGHTRWSTSATTSWWGWGRCSSRCSRSRRCCSARAACSPPGPCSGRCFSRRRSPTSRPPLAG